MTKQEQKRGGKKSLKPVSNAEAKAVTREFLKTVLFPKKKQPAPHVQPNLADKVIQRIKDQEKKK